MAFALGGNLASPLGPPRATLRHALDRLEEAYGPLTRAPLYRTRPVAALPQPDYLNTVALGHVRRDVSPHEVLARCKALEAESGRDLSPEAPRDGPRPLDIDVLWIGAKRLDTPTLVLPHPRLTTRRFVLTPLADVAAEVVVPGTEWTVAQWLEALPEGGREAVERLEEISSVSDEPAEPRSPASPGPADPPPDDR